MTLRSLPLYFVLGLITDVLIVLYYRMISAGHILPAVVLSIIITVVPFFVIERSVYAQDRRLFIAYAFGAGLGTWAAFGAGRVLVGLDSGDADFDTVEKTGGAKAVTLTEAQMPSHRHVEYAPTSASGGAVRFGTDTNANGSADSTLDTGYAGSGEAHANVQPYIVVYFWKRTA